MESECDKSPRDYLKVFEVVLNAESEKVKSLDEKTDEKSPKHSDRELTLENDSNKEKSYLGNSYSGPKSFRKSTMITTNNDARRPTEPVGLTRKSNMLTL